MKTLLPRLFRRSTEAVMLSAIGVQHVLAANIGDVPDTGGPGDLAGALQSVINFIMLLLGSIAVLVIVIAGVRMIVGGGDEGERSKARDAIIYAVVGLIIVLIASAIVNFVANNMGS